MVYGGIVAVLLAVATYFVGKFLVSTQRERLALSAFLGGAVCISTSGFLFSTPIGYLAVGLLSLLFSILLGYEAGA